MSRKETSRSDLRCRLPIGLVVWMWLAAPLHAGDGPGLGNLTYPQIDLWDSIEEIDSPGDHGTAAMINGYLMIIYSEDGGTGNGGIEFWDVSDPYNPSRHKRIDNSATFGLREAHGFSFARVDGDDLLLAQSTDGVHIWDVTDPSNISRVAALSLPGIEAGDYSGAWWVFWQHPYAYVAGVAEGLYILETTNPSAPILVNQVPASEMGGINPGIVNALGNMLFVMRHDNDGYATLDISDPIHPQLIDSTTGGSIGYSHFFASGYILTAGGGEGGSRSMNVYEVAEDGELLGKLGRGGLSCDGVDLNNGGYGSYQDGYYFGGFSNRVAKFDVQSRSLMGCGTSSIPQRDEDFAQVMGNLVWGGNDHGQGSGLIVHQLEPDTTPPQVEWIQPLSGAANQALTTRVGVSMSDVIDLDSITSTTFTVRPLGGAALSGSYSVQGTLVNFSPEVALLDDTTYEVLIEGVEDVVGNAGGLFSSTFSTGSFSDLSCDVAALMPALTGASTPFDAAQATGSTPLSYSWDFGDGSAPTGFSSTPNATHAYSSPGRYSVSLTVSNASGQSSCSAVQIVYNALTSRAPTASTPITADAQRVFNVNPDHNSVTAIAQDTLAVLWEVPVGRYPRTLALAPNGDLWVVNQNDATIDVLAPDTGARRQQILLPFGSRPYGLAFAPDGRAAYVTLSGSERLQELSLAGEPLRDVLVGPMPRALAVAGSSSRITLTRFVSEPARLEGSLILPQAQVREISAGSLSVLGVRTLAFDAGPDTELSGRGVPNFLGAIRISPDGQRALIASNKSNVARGDFLDGQSLTFESRVRTILSSVDLDTGNERLEERVDLNDRDMAQSVLFSPLGDLIFIAVQGSNQVEVLDASTRESLASLSTASAPQGLVIGESLQGQARLYVHNFLSRSVSVFDVQALLSAQSNSVVLLGEVATVDSEALAPQVLAGKQLFYHAADPRMSRDGYLSCASCHIEGMHDGQAWDFTQAGEGLRNTIDLRGRAGMAHGNVHWTANFDEIQDFENDIRGAFGGEGFLSQSDFNATADPLGATKAGRSSDLDALAAYVSSLVHTPSSPFRSTDGTLTAQALDGAAVFAAKQCDACHIPPAYTDFQRHDVGTIIPASGQGVGVPLAGVGFETPTLRGIWASAPYLHSGQAATLGDVLSLPAHVGALSTSEKDQLSAFLLQLDDWDDNLPPQLQSPGLQNSDAGEAVDWMLSASDPDADPLLFTAQGLPPGVALRRYDGRISGVPQMGTYNVLTSVDDGLHSVSRTFTWAVGVALPADSDADGVADIFDNCTEAANDAQRDTNADGFGNACDADLDNNNTVDFADLALLKSLFFSQTPDADLDGDNNVNFADLAVMKALFFLPPGPSGLSPQ